MVRVKYRTLALTFFGVALCLASLRVFSVPPQRSRDCRCEDAGSRKPCLQRNLSDPAPLSRLAEDARRRGGPVDPQRRPGSEAVASKPTSSAAATASTTAAAVRKFPPLYRPVLHEGLDCFKVWHGNVREAARAARELNATLPARRPPGFYEAIAKNCSQYRQENGYIMETSEEERNFPLAFTILAYKDPEQVERLLRAVYRPHNAYCIHLDLKTKPQVVQQIRSLIRCLPNVIESPKRVDVVWGHFTVLEPELICMEALWRMGINWKYLINLTGQEFPLKTNKQLVKILTIYRGANDIMGKPPYNHNKWRWAKKRRPPHNISIAKGPVHVAASRGFVDFLLNSKQAHDFLAWTKDTGIPDETYFATMNNQHHLKVPGSYTGNLTANHRIMLNRFKIWDTSNRTCSGRFVRHICNFGLRELAIMATSRHFVANKFTYDVKPLAFDCTEQWYFDRVRAEDTTGVVHVDKGYYSNLQIVKHAFRGEDLPSG